MKVLLVLLFAFITIEAKSQKLDLTGVWTASGTDWEFNLNIIQQDLKLSGSHCIIARNGNRLDCMDDESDISFTGTINNTPIVMITFKSYHGSVQGRATIKRINPTTIEWRIIQEPKGEFHFPAHATLTKAEIGTPDYQKD